ncbi:hypothetical protein BN946_scf184493.g18 [Trametes cinnabarina]|uniref:Uncharacterized protein n=1 Tax=Pycnoporus cinnabarinus TaxID=5643 RepID=A0A060SMV0_PYCCI|nr:hypothetical protein BN946_scf184493.g18 [Trametes cinnabarina]
MADSQTPGGEDVPLSSPDKGVNVPRAEFTIDTLAALQAHSLRLSRISTLVKDEGLQDLTQASEARLLDVVARSRNSSSNDPEVIAMHKKCLKAAKSRARENVHYNSPLPFEEENEDVQYVSERINMAFANLTAPQLGEALKKEVAAAQGHVDALRLSIVNNSPRADPTQGPHNARTLDRGRYFTQRLAEIKDIFTDNRIR